MIASYFLGTARNHILSWNQDEEEPINTQANTEDKPSYI